MAMLKQSEIERSKPDEVLHPVLAVLEGVNSVKDPMDRLAILARRSAELCGMYRCSILLTNQDEPTLWPVMSQFASGKSDSRLWRIFKSKLRVAIDEVPEFAKVLSDGLSLVVQADSQSEHLRELLEPFRIKSLLLVPIRVEARSCGIMMFDTTKQSEKFFKEQSKSAERICSSLGFAIESAYQETKSYKRSDRTKGLLGLIGPLLQAGNLETTLEIVWKFVRDKLGVMTFYVALYDPRKDSISFPIFLDRGEKIVVPDRVLTDQAENWGITGWIARNQQKLYWPTPHDREQECARLGIAAIQTGDPCESCVYFPLIVKGALVGVVSFQSYTPYAFDEHDRQVLEDTADLMAGAIVNAQLALNLDKTIKDLHMLVTATRLMGNEVPDLSQILNQVGDSVHSIFPEADRAAIHLWDADEKLLKLRASTYNFSSDAENALSFKSGEGIAGWVYREKRPACVIDVEQDARYKKVLHPEVLPYKSMISVPLLWKDRALGTLTLANLSRSGAFIEDDLGLLIACAEHATVTIQNALNFHWLESLSMEIGAATEPDAILRTLLTASNQVLDFTAAVLHVVDPQTEDILRTIVFPPEMNSLGIPPRLGEGLTRAVIQSRSPVIVSDASRDDRVNLKVLAAGVKSLIGLPLIARERVRGVLFLDNNTDQQFEPRELTLLTVLANLAAIALDNIRLHEQRDALSQLIQRILETAQQAGKEEHLLNLIIESAVSLLSAQGGAVYFLDQERKRFVLEASIGVPLTPDTLTFDASEGLSGYILKTSEAYIVNDYYKSEFHRTALDGLRLTAVAGAPFFYGQLMQGTIVVHDSRDHIRFGEGERHLIEQFANYVSIAMRIARVIGEQREAIRALDDTRSTVSETLHLSVTSELRRTLDGIVEGSRTALGCDVVTLYAYDEERNEFKFPPSYVGVRDMRKLLEMGQVAQHSVPYRIISLDQPRYTENTIGDTIMGGQFTIREKVVASVGIPLIAHGHRVGVMCINYRTLHRFKNDERANISIFGDQAAIAIYTAQLYEQLKERSRALASIYVAGRAMTATSNLDEIFIDIAKQAWDVTAAEGAGAHFCHIVMVEDKRLRIVAAYPPSVAQKHEALIADMDLSREGLAGIVGRVAKNGKTAFVPNVKHDREYIQLEPDVCSQISVPVKLEDRVAAIITVEHTDSDALDQVDQDSLETLSTYAVKAIQVAQAYDELKKAQVQLAARTATAWIGMTSSAWRHVTQGNAITIRNEVDQLRRVLYDLLERNLSSDVLKGRIEASLETIHKQAVKIIEEPITAPIGSEEDIESIPVNSFIAERLKQHQESKPSSFQFMFEASVSDSATVRASREWLRRALDYVLDNAVKAVSQNVEKRITVMTRQKDNLVEIVVSDTGLGIPRDVLPRLFVEVIRKSSASSGMGAGLLQAQTIVEAYQGSIYIESPGPNPPTTLVMTFPLEA